MNDMKVCGNHEALIGYLYDECEPAEHAAVAAHVAVCASCAEEVQALRDTRAHLVSWAAPALPLGLQLTRTEAEVPANVLQHTGPASRSSKREGWWSRPLPAWAQAAAAVVIFAAGMSVNIVRSSDEAPAAVAQAPVPQPVAAQTPVGDMTVTRAEFTRLAERLRAIEHADVQLASRTGRDVDQDELFARLGAIEDRVSESERQNLGRFATLVRAMEENRRDIDASREATQRVNQMESELQDHRQVLRSALVPGGLAVRTAFTGGGR